ncbi:hsp70-Hsp90 organizing protein-like [Panicum virgatum]|nr:hsp70-Hsp90 organizing protein-like [Panicum virgatum]
MRVDRYDAELFANRSLCWFRRGDGRRALRDAVKCKILRPKWAKAYFRYGQALMLMKDYEKACDTIAEGLELDPLNDELDKLYWEAMELKNVGSERLRESTRLHA